MNTTPINVGQQGARVVPLRVPIPGETLVYDAAGRAVAAGLRLVIGADGHVYTTPWMHSGDQQIAVRIREAA